MGLQAKRVLSKTFIERAIPGKREPEFGRILENMADHQTIYNLLSTHPDITILSVGTPLPKYLVSLALDTVDEDGNPTRELSKLKLEMRTRFSIWPHSMEITTPDVSVKDAEKTGQRREWEAKARRLGGGVEEVLAIVDKDVPGAANIDPRSVRVSSVALTSRADYLIQHDIRGDIGGIKYENCNDAVVFSSPYADRILGYRREVELEGKKIGYKPEAKVMNEDVDNALLDISETIMRGVITTGGSFLADTEDASISKVRHANEMVRHDYRQNHPHLPPRDGLDTALKMGVKPEHFLSAQGQYALKLLTETIPPASLLIPGADTGAYKDYFPEAEKYPLMPRFM